MAVQPYASYDRLEHIVNPFDDQEDDEEYRRSYLILKREQLNLLADSDRNLKGTFPTEPLFTVGRLYLEYKKIIEQLDKIWGETYQYQKNTELRRILDAAYTRLLELKEILTEIEMTEFHYIDSQLYELKIIPHDLEIINLSSVPAIRDSQLQELAERLYKGERIYVPPVESDAENIEHVETNKAKLSIKRPVKIVDLAKEALIQAVQLIQKHERARIGRLNFFDENTDFKLRQTYDRPKPIPNEIGNPAALVIQRWWRGYKARQLMKRREVLRRLILKMYVPSYMPPKQDHLEKETLVNRRIKREQKAKEYINTCLKEKERIVKWVAPGLMEDIGDEIRWWFRNWYDVAKAFDKYPTKEKGGTIIVIRGETLTPEEYRIEQERKRIEREKLKKNPGLAKKLKMEAEKKKKEAEKRAKENAAKLKKEKAQAKRAAKEAEKLRKKGIIEPYSFPESNALNLLTHANAEYDKNWTAVDDSLVVKNDPVIEKITNQKCYELQLECRELVDEMMRLELEQLEEAHARDRGTKLKKKNPKRGKGKKGKKKKNKDITAHRVVEDLFQELYDNNIIRTYPAVDLNTFIGDYSYKNSELRAVDLDPPSSVGDIKRIIMTTCIMPLAGDCYPKPKSVCIAGPRQSGKHRLAYAICNESNAVMFDLSPPALAWKYPGKDGMKMLIHLINKMSRILQPSVIFVDGAEKAFYKKVPKPDRDFEPKKMKSQMFKGIVKLITPKDRVMVIGISGQPWVCKQKPFVKCYEKFLMLPRTDYGTIYQLWMDILMKYHGVERDFDVSAVTKMSVGYPIPYIQEVAAKVLCPSRLIRFKFNPLKPAELLEGLMVGGQPEPVTVKERDKFINWYNKKTKIGKMRHRFVSAKRELRLIEEAQAAKEKDKKKKK